jgi:hypothetical protein
VRRKKQVHPLSEGPGFVGIQVSLFIDPEPAQVDAAATRRVRVELNTRAYLKPARSRIGTGTERTGKVRSRPGREGSRSCRPWPTYRNVRLISDIENNILNIAARASRQDAAGGRRDARRQAADPGRAPALIQNAQVFQRRWGKAPGLASRVPGLR